MTFSRLEDRRFVTGAGRYVSDWNFPGQRHAAFLRADRAHARIVSIDIEAARAMPGVRAVITAADTAAAGFRSLPCAAPIPGKGGSALLRPERPVLAADVVRFVGECVVCVVADTAIAAQDAVEAIIVEYEDLPVVMTAEAAVAAGAPQLHPAIPGNVAIEFETGDPLAVAAAFEGAAHVVSLDLHNQRVVGSPMEPKGCLARHDPETGDYFVHVCTQGTTGMRAQLVATTGIPDEHVHIVAEDVGGGFGLRFNAYPEYSAIMLAARLTGAPVRWVASRSEVFLSDEHARGVSSRGEVALDAEGNFLAFRFNFLNDMGAYIAPTGPVVAVLSIRACLAGVYRVPAAVANVRLALTNSVPMAAYRGAGRPVISYMIERLVDQAATELGIDPVELRRRNLIPPTAMPWKTVNGLGYDSGDFPAVLDKALGLADWHGFAARRAEASARGHLRGIGLATFIESTGGGASPDEVEARFGDHGEITIHAVSHSHGQSHETAYAELLAAVLGLPRERFRLRNGDPAVRLAGNPTGGSRTMHGVGSALRVLADDIIAKGLALAGRYFQPDNPATGVVSIERYTAVDDAGNLLNPTIVAGQMHGAIVQGAGQVLGEHAIYDLETGQFLTGSFMDYAMPKAVNVHGLVIADHPVPTPTNVLGVKGVGEAGVTGSLPALMNAILEALRPVGVTHFDMPATPARVWGAIGAARSGEGRRFAHA